jgi:uncharacterized membrane protein
MLYAGLKTLHVLSIILWVGGMIFAHCFLRPALASLEPPTRLKLMQQVLTRFFQAVLPACLLALGTGVWMISHTARALAQAGTPFTMPLHWSFMGAAGTAMVVIFLFIRFALFPRFLSHMASANWPQAAARLRAISRWVVTNLIIGLLIIIVAMAGA